MDQTPTKGGESSPSKLFSKILVKRRRHPGAIIALAFTFIFILLAVSPAVQPAEAAPVNWGDVTAAAELGGIYALVSPAYSIYMLQQWLASMISMPNGQYNYAHQLANSLDNLLIISHSAALNADQLYNLTLSYYAAKAEWATKTLYDYQTAHSLAHIYNADWVLSQGGITNDTMTYLWNVENLYIEALKYLTDIDQAFAGPYANMDWGLYLTTGAYASQEASNQYDYIKVGQNSAWIDPIISFSTGVGKYVQIATDNPFYFIVPPSSSITAHFTRLADGSVHNISLANSVAAQEVVSFDHLPFVNGEYNVNYTGGTPIAAFGSASPVPLNSGTVSPSLLFLIKSGTNSVDWLAYYSVIGSGGSQYSVWQKKGGSLVDGGGYTQNVHPAVLVTTSAGWNASDNSQAVIATNPSADLVSCLYDMGIAMTHLNSMLSTVNSYAFAYWQTEVSTGGHAPGGLFPSMVFPDPSQMQNMTWQQMYAIYIAWLKNLNGWFNANDYFNATNVNLSVESLNLMCRGPVYYPNGTEALNSSAIWTPYVTTADMRLNKSVNNTMTQAGFLIVWGYNSTLTSNHDTWQAQRLVYLPITVGWKLKPLEIMYNGESVDSVNLTVTSLQRIITILNPPVGPPGSTTDLAWLLAHWYLIALVLGIVIALGAIAIRNWMFFGIGMVIIVVAIVFWYLAGFPILSDLLNIHLSALPPPRR